MSMRTDSELTILDAAAMIHQLLLTLPVKVCAGCRMLFDPRAEWEVHLQTCPYAPENGPPTEVDSYRNIIEAEAAGPVYRPSRLLSEEPQGEA